MNNAFEGFEVKNVYLNTSVMNCLKRISIRGREGESKISQEYLEGLQKRYMQLPFDIIIDGNQNLGEMEEFARKFVSVELGLANAATAKDVNIEVF